MSIYSKQSPPENGNRVDRNQKYVLWNIQGPHCTSVLPVQTHVLLARGQDAIWLPLHWKGNVICSRGGTQGEESAVEKVLNPSVSRTDYLSSPSRLHGNKLFPLHKPSDPERLSRTNQWGFVVRKRGHLKGFCSQHKRYAGGKASRANVSLEAAVSQQVNNTLTYFHKWV